MKHLKKYEFFLLLEEAELKSSASLSKKLLDLFNKCVDEMDSLGKFDSQTGKQINKEEYVEKFNQRISDNVSDILYDKFLIKLGAVVLQKGAETSYRYDDKFMQDLKESISSKQLKGSLDVLDKCKVGLKFMPFYKEVSGGRISFGSLTTFREMKDPDDCIVIFGLSLNVLKHEQIREELDETIRHELQHLTQCLNTFCLYVGEYISRNKNLESKQIYDIIENSYKRMLDEKKVGGGKTRTGLKQTQKPKNFDPETGRKYSDEEKSKESQLNYLLDDVEYKPWITDKVNDYFKKWLDENKDNFKYAKMSYNFKKEFGLLNEKLTDEQQKKMEIKKRLGQMCKQNNMSYIDFVNSLNKFSIENISKEISENIIKNDPEIKIIKSMRKEVPADILKLIRLRIKKEIEKN